MRGTLERNEVEETSSSTTTRRNWLQLSLGTLAAGVWCSSAGHPSSAWAANATRIPESPDEALAILREGNQRFVEGKSLSVHRDLDRVKEVAPRQTPFAAFLGCADSRVPIEIVFDQGFGDLFVTRIAGNVATPEGAEDNDLVQGPNDVYEGNWLDDVIAGGGGERHGGLVAGVAGDGAGGQHAPAGGGSSGRATGRRLV